MCQCKIKFTVPSASDTTEADTEEGSSEAETQEPQVQMQKAQ